jgi:hypothetical protein
VQLSRTTDQGDRTGALLLPVEAIVSFHATR